MRKHLDWDGVLVRLGVCLALAGVGCSGGDPESDASQGAAGDGPGSGGTSAGSGGGGPGSGGTSAGNEGGGQSACGLFQCEAGQHCSNGACVNGCLTDGNCAAKQRCEDIDTTINVGTCRNVTQTPAKDCDAFCAKAVACNAPDADSCQQICAALSSACVVCASDANCSSSDCDEVCDL